MSSLFSNFFFGSRPRFARFTPDVRLFFRTGHAISFILQPSASHLVSALFNPRPTRKPCNVLTFFAISYFPFVDRLAIAPEEDRLAIAPEKDRLAVAADQETKECRHAMTPGNFSANTRNPTACANTCSPSKLVSAPTPADTAPMKRSGASPLFSTTSTTNAGPTTTTPPTKNIPPKAQKYSASLATAKKSPAPFSRTPTTPASRASPRSNTPCSPAT